MADGDELLVQDGNAQEPSDEGQAPVAPVAEQAATTSASAEQENIRRLQSTYDRRIAEVERELHMTRAQRDSLEAAYNKAVNEGSISSEEALAARLDRMERMLAGPKPEQQNAMPPQVAARIQTAMELADSLGIDPTKVRGYRADPEEFIAGVKSEARKLQEAVKRQEQQAAQRKAAASPAFAKVDSGAPVVAGKLTTDTLNEWAARGELAKHRDEINAAIARGDFA